MAPNPLWTWKWADFINLDECAISGIKGRMYFHDFCSMRIAWISEKWKSEETFWHCTVALLQYPQTCIGHQTAIIQPEVFMSQVKINKHHVVCFGYPKPKLTKKSWSSVGVVEVALRLFWKMASPTASWWLCRYATLEENSLTQKHPANQLQIFHVSSDV